MILSGPSLYDKATLQMTIEFLLKKNNCHNIISELKNRKDDAAPILLKSQLTKCSTRSDKPLWQNSDYEVYGCPCNYLHPSALILIQAASAMKIGVLPYDGGLLDQPAILMELIAIAQGVLSDYEEKMMKEQQKKSGSKR
jgi:hypothetical protein